MMPMVIPASQRANFQVFYSLGREQVEQFSKELESIQPSLEVDLIAKEMKRRLNISPEDTRRILILLLSMQSGRRQNNASPVDFVESIISGTLAEGEVKIDVNDVEWVKTSLVRLLNCEPIYTPTYKALRLQTESQRVFEDARIITDVRPVFQEDIETGMVGAVISHSLRISYTEAGYERSLEFFVGLRTSELKLLQQQVERAIKKAEYLLQKPLGTYLLDL